MYCKIGRGMVARLLLICVLTFFTAGTFSVAVQAEDNNKELSLNEAISLALKHSEAVKKADREVEKNEEMMSYREDQLGYKIAYGLTGAAHGAVESLWAASAAANLEYQMSEKTLTAEQDKVLLDTCNKYWNVVKAKQSLETAEIALDNARRQLQNSRVAFQVGQTANINLIGAEAQYEGAKAVVAVKENELINAYTAFNKLIGAPAGECIELSDTVNYEPVAANLNLEYQIAKVLENSPTVWQAQEMITMQNYLKELTSYTGEYRPYRAREIEVEQAELNSATAKKTFESLTRDLYHGIKSLEEAYAGAQERVKVAEETLRVKKIMHEVGMATATDVLSAEKDLADAKYSAFEIACRHAYMKLAFEKPWAANAAAM